MTTKSPLRDQNNTWSITIDLGCHLDPAAGITLPVLRTMIEDDIEILLLDTTFCGPLEPKFRKDDDDGRIIAENDLYQVWTKQEAGLTLRVSYAISEEISTPSRVTAKEGLPVSAFRHLNAVARRW